MIRKKINYFEQPPKIFASVEVHGAQIIRQTYDVNSGEYYPNRSLVPLKLTPVVGYTIGEKVVENAASELIDAHWYRFDNLTKKDKQFTAETEISTGVLYTIDKTIGSSTYGELTTRENVMPDNPVTYAFVATLNIGEGYRVMASFSLDSVTAGVIPMLDFDNADTSRFNPWDETMPRYFTINPKIMPASLASSVLWQYKWESYINDTWTPLGTLPEDWAVEKQGNGVCIDRQYMPEEILLRCTASALLNGQNVQLVKYVSHRRRLPAFLADIGQVADIGRSVKTLNPRAMIQTGRQVITDTKREVNILWYGSDASPVATGLTPSIPVAALGTDMDLGLDIQDAGGYKVLKTRDGDYITTNDGAFILLK